MTIQRPSPRRAIPENALLQYQGVLFQVFTWDQELFDGSTTTFEGLRRPDTINVIAVTPDKHIILGRQEQPGLQPFIGLFGGRIDSGEDPETAARRELLEEGGLQAATMELWFTDQPLEKTDWAVYTFVARDCVQIAPIHNDPGEKVEIFSTSFDEFLDAVAQLGFRDREVALRTLRATRTPEQTRDFRAFLLG